MDKDFIGEEPDIYRPDEFDEKHRKKGDLGRIKGSRPSESVEGQGQKAKLLFKRPCLNFGQFVEIVFDKESFSGAKMAVELVKKIKDDLRAFVDSRNKEGLVSFAENLLVDRASDSLFSNRRILTSFNLL